MAATGGDAIRRLVSKVEQARPALEKLDRYYEGTQALAFLAPEVREAVGNRLRNLVINWPRLVVSAIEERLDVEGFRIGEDSDPNPEAWAIWQANGLDEASQQAHAEALVHGRCYVAVWARTEGDPLITVESARQCYVEVSPDTRERTLGVKRWVDAEGFAHVTVYGREEVVRYMSKDKAPVAFDQFQLGPLDMNDPEAIADAGWSRNGDPVPNPLGVVPLVPLVNRPRLLNPDGESELSDVLPICDAVNKLGTDMMVSAEYSAQPRRWATGIEIVEEPVTDDDGNPTGETQPAANFSPVAGRTWVAEDPDTKFGQFPEASLDGYVHAVELLTQQLSSITGIPPHYLNILKGQLTSAESIRAAEASLVAKARRKQRSFGGTWEEVMRLALHVRHGSVPSGADSMEVIWRDPETRTKAEQADAALKLVQGQIIPPQQAQEDLGYSPQQIDRMRVMRRQSSLDTAAASLGSLTP